MKIETIKGHELVGKAILSKIHTGEWVPGEKLPSVVDLSIAFGVGRSTIREALSALKAMGWLDIRHGGGTFVKKELPSDTNNSNPLFQEADSILELLEVRKVLEAGTVALAAQRRSDDDLVAIKGVLHKMEQALIEDHTTAGEQADLEFHVAIASASKNSLLIHLMDSLTSRLNETISKTRELWFYQEKATASRLLEEHQSIYTAIAEKKAVEATKLIEAHLTKVELVLKKSL